MNRSITVSVEHGYLRIYGFLAAGTVCIRPTVMTGKDRRYLRALAHELRPVVIVGQRGLTPAVVRQVDGALTDHELIKVRLGADCPVDQAAAAAALTADCGCAVAGAIGHVLILYRANRDEPQIRLPSAAPAAPEELPGC